MMSRLESIKHIYTSERVKRINNVRALMNAKLIIVVTNCSSEEKCLVSKFKGLGDKGPEFSILGIPRSVVDEHVLNIIEFIYNYISADKNIGFSPQDIIKSPTQFILVPSEVVSLAMYRDYYETFSSLKFLFPLNDDTIAIKELLILGVTEEEEKHKILDNYAAFLKNNIFRNKMVTTGLAIKKGVGKPLKILHLLKIKKYVVEQYLENIVFPRA